MKKLALKHALAAILLVLSFAAPVVAGPYEDAAAALSRGDYATAMRLFRSLAEQGDAKAQFTIGLMYVNGQGVQRNDAEALRWYRLAADRDDARAQFNLGIMYRNGQGVPQDYVRAFMWFTLSAARGNQSAINNRDIVAQRMTPAQIAEAQKLASEWKLTTQPPR